MSLDPEKLVRDRIPEIIRLDGGTPIVRTARETELPEFLLAKLYEEVDEYRESGEVDELVDILEVVYMIAAIKGIPFVDIEKLRHRKRFERGGFNKRIVLIKGNVPTPAA